MKPESLRHWQVLASEYVIDSKFLRVRRDRVLLPNGQVLPEYYVQESKGHVSVFCVTEEGKVPLIRQYRHGIGRVMYLLPSGMYDDEDPAPIDAAKRELEEETGYSVPQLELVAEMSVDPARSTGRYRLFLGRGATRVGNPTRDASEEIEVVLSDPREVLQMVRSGEIFGMGQVAAIYTACDRLGIL